MSLLTIMLTAVSLMCLVEDANGRHGINAAKRARRAARKKARGRQQRATNTLTTDGSDQNEVWCTFRSGKEDWHVSATETSQCWWWQYVPGLLRATGTRPGPHPLFSDGCSKLSKSKRCDCQNKDWIKPETICRLDATYGCAKCGVSNDVEPFPAAAVPTTPATPKPTPKPTDKPQTSPARCQEQDCVDEDGKSRIQGNDCFLMPDQDTCLGNTRVVPPRLWNHYPEGLLPQVVFAGCQCCVWIEKNWQCDHWQDY